jgi:hypothetical protein
MSGRRAALRRGARERQRAGGENGPAIDDIHARSPPVFLLFDGVSSLLGYARQANPHWPLWAPPAHNQREKSPLLLQRNEPLTGSTLPKQKARASAGLRVLVLRRKISA